MSGYVQAVYDYEHNTPFRHGACCAFHMEKHIITIVLNDKPYQLYISIDHQEEEITYRVEAGADEGELEKIIPERLEIRANGKVTFDERLKTVESEQIARLIWQEILNKLNP